MNSEPTASAGRTLTVRYGGAMLLGRDRIFYTGPLRRSMKARKLGAVSIYATPNTAFDISIDGGPRRACNIAAVPAHVPHRIEPPRGPMWNLLVEPESVTPDAIRALLSACNGSDSGRMLLRLRQAEASLLEGLTAEGPGTDDFDRLFFGARLARRPLDPRIVAALAMLEDEQNDVTLSVESCARAVGLSESRFSHLFRDETGVAFRSLKMWKRARRFLDQAKGEASLTDVALGLGYPDSSHFSHSIIKTFGMQPGAIRSGARNLIIWPGAGYTLFAA